MGQICGSRITGMGCNFMGVLFLSRWLPGSGLCKRRVHQGQAAIWGEALSPPVSETGMQIVTALERWHGTSLPRLGICSSSAFLFPILCIPFPHTHLFVSGCIFCFFFFQLHSFSCFFLFLSRPFLFRSSFLVLSGPSGPLDFSFLVLLEMELGFSCEQIDNWQLMGRWLHNALCIVAKHR